MPKPIFLPTDLAIVSKLVFSFALSDIDKMFINHKQKRNCDDGVCLGYTGLIDYLLKCMPCNQWPVNR